MRLDVWLANFGVAGPTLHRVRSCLLGNLGQLRVELEAGDGAVRADGVGPHHGGVADVDANLED